MTKPERLERTQSVLVLIDLQEKLMPVIHEADGLLRNVERLIRGSHVLGVPTLLTEQYTRGLGPTVASVRNVLEETSGYSPIEKNCFSADRCEAFAAKVAALGRRQILLAGVEAHVCVYQTAADLLVKGASVSVIADAISSRAPSNREIALQRLRSEGATITSTEMALFELTENAGTNEFRAISKLVR